MNRRGVALVLVLWILVILGTVATHVVGGARTSAQVAGNARARLTARHAAESGVLHAVATIEAGLRDRDSSGAEGWLNALEDLPRDSVALGDGRFQWAVVDPSTRLDVNSAPVANLARLLSAFGDPGRAMATAQAIRQWIERPTAATSDQVATAARFVTPVRSLESLREIPGVDAALVERAAPYLTIDGDGTVHATRAPQVVRDAAFGDLTRAPTRLVIVARGWRSGHPLTHEVQAVYAISNGTLAPVSWRERDR